MIKQKVIINLLVERPAQNFKNLNLENLDLVELNAQEVQETEGGGFPPMTPTHVSIALIHLGMGILGALAGVGDGVRSGMNP